MHGRSTPTNENEFMTADTCEIIEQCRRSIASNNEWARRSLKSFVAGARRANHVAIQFRRTGNTAYAHKAARLRDNDMDAARHIRACLGV